MASRLFKALSIRIVPEWNVKSYPSKLTFFPPTIRIVPEWNVKAKEASFWLDKLGIRIVPEWNVKFLAVLSIKLYGY